MILCLFIVIGILTTALTHLVLTRKEAYWRGFSDGETNGYREGVAKRKGLRFHDPSED